MLADGLNTGIPHSYRKGKSSALPSKVLGSGDALLIESRDSHSLTCCPHKPHRLSAGIPARRIRFVPFTHPLPSRS